MPAGQFFLQSKIRTETFAVSANNNYTKPGAAFLLACQHFRRAAKNIVVALTFALLWQWENLYLGGHCLILNHSFHEFGFDWIFSAHPCRVAVMLGLMGIRGERRGFMLIPKTKFGLYRTGTTDLQAR